VAELKSELERSEELFQKTNQFNFSNRRSKLNDPEMMSQAKLLVSSVADVYSDSGLISALMYKKIPENVIIISEFVISCRALGRGIEKYIFKSMLDVMKDIGDLDSKTEIRAEFLSTSRNIPASDFLIEWFSESNLVGTYKLNVVFLRQVSNSFGSP
jgi:FkbH-like protein